MSIEQSLIGRDGCFEAPEDYVVVVGRTLRNGAVCSCGWESGKRFLLASAKIEALLHSADTGHEPTIPLVVRIGRKADVQRA